MPLATMLFPQGKESESTTRSQPESEIPGPKNTKQKIATRIPTAIQGSERSTRAPE
jgi:hypothetical protein